MNSKNHTKIILDIVMTVLFLILIDPKNTGMTLHEIFGLSMGAFFTTHIILNWSWVKNITKNLLNPKLKSKPKLFYVLNAVSFISVTTIIVTGIEISQVLFVSESAGASHVALHKWVSYFCVGLFGVHIALHWRFILNTMRRLLADMIGPNLGKAVMSVGAVVLVMGLLYSQIASSATDDADKISTRGESPNHRREFYRSQPGEGRDNIISTDSGATYEYPTEADQDNTISADVSDAGDTVTLADYLEKMFCNGCSKHCSLLNLQCDKGTPQLQAAKIQYQQLYVK